MPRELLVLPYGTSLTEHGTPRIRDIAGRAIIAFRGAYSGVRILPARTAPETELQFSGFGYHSIAVPRKLSGENLTETLYEEFGQQHTLILTDLPIVITEIPRKEFDTKEEVHGKAVPTRINGPRGKAFVSPIFKIPLDPKNRHERKKIEHMYVHVAIHELGHLSPWNLLHHEPKDECGCVMEKGDTLDFCDDCSEKIDRAK